MNYEVVLSLEAVEDVLRIAAASPSKATVIDASKRLQEALKQDPDDAGSHLSEGLYFIDREPLRAFFVIDGDKATVEIVHVKPIQPSSEAQRRFRFTHPLVCAASLYF